MNSYAETQSRGVKEMRLGNKRSREENGHLQPGYSTGKQWVAKTDGIPRVTGGSR